jgi:type 1 glutamine amidotransferase
MHELQRSEIEQMVPSKLSVMPTGLIDKLDEDQRRDLMSYLMKPPPSMPLSGPIAAPRVRTAAEVSRVLEGSRPLPENLRQLRVVLVAGPKDHGPAEHDYPAWLMQWGQLLTAAEDLEVQVAWEFPEPDQIEQADVLIFFQKGSWDQARARAMDAYFERGGGAIYLHWAVNGSDRVEDFSKRIGLASWGGKIKYRHGPLELQITDSAHPIMRNVPTMDLLDESYWLLTGDTKRIGLLASSMEEGEATPQMWTYEPGRGRVLVSIPGHYSWTFDDPIFRTVVLRAIAWVSNEPIDRFNELVPLGARMTGQKDDGAKR